MGTPLGFQTEHSVQIAMDRHVEPAPSVTSTTHVTPIWASAPSRKVASGVRRPAGHCGGEEVTFDYAMTEYRHYARRTRGPSSVLSAKCGSVRCRGRLGYYAELSDELRREYADYTSSYLTEIRTTEPLSKCCEHYGIYRTNQPAPFLSLRIKLVLGFTLVFNAVFVLTFIWFYSFASNSATNQIRADLVDTLNGALAGIDGNEFAR
ncbi:MAG: hypothetical protein R2838_07085 [Caldilineaceae bacterium]